MVLLPPRNWHSAHGLGLSGYSSLQEVVCFPYALRQIAKSRRTNKENLIIVFSNVLEVHSLNSQILIMLHLIKIINEI